MHIDALETYLWATAYFCIFCAYFVHIYTYFNLHITAPLPLCLFKHTLRVWAYNSHVYAYFENAYLSETVHFEQELRVLSLVQRRGALPRKDRRKEPSRWQPAVGAARPRPSRASSPLATLQLFVVESTQGWLRSVQVQIRDFLCWSRCCLEFSTCMQ